MSDAITLYHGSITDFLVQIEYIHMYLQTNTKA
jgi:hypothetical protein